MRVVKRDMYVFVNKDLMFIDGEYDVTKSLEEAMMLYTLEDAKIVRQELDEPEEWAIAKVVHIMDLEGIVEGELK